MEKKVNYIDYSQILCGVGCGDHRPAVSDFEDLSKDLEGFFDVLSVRLHSVDYPDEMFYNIAEIAKQRQIYFAFLYAYQFAPKGKKSHLNQEIVKRVKEIAGEYFLGEIFA